MGDYRNITGNVHHQLNYVKDWTDPNNKVKQFPHRNSDGNTTLLFAVTADNIDKWIEAIEDNPSGFTPDAQDMVEYVSGRMRLLQQERGRAAAAAAQEPTQQQLNEAFFKKMNAANERGSWGGRRRKTKKSKRRQRKTRRKTKKSKRRRGGVEEKDMTTAQLNARIKELELYLKRVKDDEEAVYSVEPGESKRASIQAKIQYLKDLVRNK